ncbi:hypothetical protein B0O99DRAFT_587751 [Bisporella sp. PMI_857]|nr:hypothetical protein B0O99DRAFT_587751 [Bisporella sp. PMI_857]
MHTARHEDVYPNLKVVDLFRFNPWPSFQSLGSHPRMVCGNGCTLLFHILYENQVPRTVATPATVPSTIAAIPSRPMAASPYHSGPSQGVCLRVASLVDEVLVVVVGGVPAEEQYAANKFDVDWTSGFPLLLWHSKLSREATNETQLAELAECLSDMSDLANCKAKVEKQKDEGRAPVLKLHLKVVSAKRLQAAKYDQEGTKHDDANRKM